MFKKINAIDIVIISFILINIIFFVLEAFPIFRSFIKETKPRLSNVSIYKNTVVEKLAYYIKNQDTIAIKKYLEKHPYIKIDTPDPYFGNSLLFYAVYNKKILSLEKLLQFGANPNTINSKGQTPLFFATYYLTDEEGANIISLLMKFGADPKYNPSGLVVLSPLYWAPLNLKTVKALIDSGLDVSDTCIANQLMKRVFDIKTAHYLVCEVGLNPDFRYKILVPIGFGQDTIKLNNYDRIMRITADSSNLKNESIRRVLNKQL